MRRSIVFWVLAVLGLAALLSASPAGKFRLIVFNDDFGQDRYKLKVVLNSFSCPGGTGSPWIGATLKTGSGQLIDLPGKAAKSSGEYEWKFSLPSGTNLESCYFTVALWCGRTCIDRVPGPVTSDPRKIRFRSITKGKDLSR